MKRKYDYNNRILAVLTAMTVAFTMLAGDALIVFADDTLPKGAVVVEEEIVGYEAGDAETEPGDEGDGVAEMMVPEAEITTEDQEQEITAEEIQYYEDVANGAIAAEEEELTFDAMESSIAETSLVDEINGKWVKSGTSKLSVRAKAKQKTNSYGVLQGCCTDGKKFVYLSFNRKSDDAVRIVKMQITENEAKPTATKLTYKAISPKLSGIAHGNDIAYVPNAGGSGKDKLLVISATTGGIASTYIATVDVATMKKDYGKAYKYWSDLSQCDPDPYPEDTTVADSNRRSLEDLVADKHGYSTIAYNQSKDLIVTTNKTDHDIMIFAPTWTSEGVLKKVQLLRYIRQNKINATSQGIDIDDDYIYTCWSPLTGKLSTNILQIYDWDGVHVGNRIVTGSYEIEDVFHIGEGTDANYYATFYTSYYKTVKTKVKYKVKWKKVRKKVNGKWKKVWKYKTKYKTVKKQVYERNAYLMYLGHLTE